MIIKFEEYNLLNEKHKKTASNLIPLIPQEFVKILHSEYNINPLTIPTEMDESKLKNDYKYLRDAIKMFKVLYINKKKDYYCLLYGPSHNNISSVVYEKGSLNDSKSSSYNRLDRLGYLTPKLSEDPDGKFYILKHGSRKKSKKEYSYEEKKEKEKEGKDVLWGLIQKFDATYSELFRSWWIKNYNMLQNILTQKTSLLAYDDDERNNYYLKLSEDLKQIRKFIENPTHKAFFFFSFDDKTEEKRKEKYGKEHILSDTIQKISNYKVSWDNSNIDNVNDFLNTYDMNRVMRLAAVALYTDQKNRIHFLNDLRISKNIEKDPEFIKQLKKGDIENLDPDIKQKHSHLFGATDYNII